MPVCLAAFNALMGYTGDGRKMRIISWLNPSGRLAVGTLLLVLIIISRPAAATDRTSDAFLTGYVTSILERDMHWQKDSYQLKIKNGSAKITLFTDDPVRRQAVDRQLREIDGLQ
ncbi:MAG: hypothetical protein IH612_12170 [Desulfofustis sp.]|nr:hypothetical protein [Desulfofustis sp.]